MVVSEPTTRPYRVLILAAYFEPGFKGGGPIRSIAALMDSAPEDVTIRVLTSDRDLGDSQPYPGLGSGVRSRGRHEVVYYNWRNPLHWPRVLRAMRQPYDLLYVNGLFDLRHEGLPFAMWRFHLIQAKRALIAPRGVLYPGALAQGSRLKPLALLVWRIFILRSGRLIWHASSQEEAGQIRQHVGGKEVVVVSPDSIARHDYKHVPRVRDDGPLRAIFCSRISPKKNLLGAVEALQQCETRIDFAIVGPIEDVEYWNRCRAILEALPANVSWRHDGAIQPEEVVERFARSDVFVFPTFGENFGHVIAESLAAGCPLICGPETPWSQIIRSSGGIVIDPNSPDEIAAAIDSFGRKSAAELAAISHEVHRAYLKWNSTPRAHLFELVRATARLRP